MQALWYNIYRKIKKEKRKEVITMTYLPSKREYFNRTHKEIDQAIKSGTVSTIGYFHRSLVNAQRELRANDPYGKNENKIKQYEKKIAKLHRVIHDNKLYENEAFYY